MLNLPYTPSFMKFRGVTRISKGVCDMGAVGALRLPEKGDGHSCPGNPLLVFVYRPGFTLLC